MTVVTASLSFSMPSSAAWDPGPTPAGSHWDLRDWEQDYQWRVYSVYSKLHHVYSAQDWAGTHPGNTLTCFLMGARLINFDTWWWIPKTWSCESSFSMYICHPTAAQWAGKETAGNRTSTTLSGYWEEWPWAEEDGEQVFWNATTHSACWVVLL